MARIAFTTFGILRAPLREPQVQGFLNRTDAVFESAINAIGFQGAPHMEMDLGDRPKPRFFVEGKHHFAPTTLSLWADLESVYAFAYSGLHSEALGNREEWFLKPEWPTYVAWWVEDSHIPDWIEACDRLEHIHDHGPTSYAFNFGKPFDPDGGEFHLDRNSIQDRKPTVH